LAFFAPCLLRAPGLIAFTGANILFRRA
jgi:hypothetical protein